MDEIERTARISECGKYRYVLSRRWSAAGGTCLWCMINPSVADALRDDQTVRKCIGYARRWGFGEMQIVNLYALRATDPGELKRFGYAAAVGPANDDTIRNVLGSAKIVIAAWGANPAVDADARSSRVVELICASHELLCLEETKSGHPRHPLYARGNLRPIHYRPKLEVPRAGSAE